jgi:hypothetical protein
MKKYLISILVILLLSLNAFAVVGEVRYEGEWTYGNLTPSALTAYKGLHFVTSDILKQTTGSAVGQSVTVNENMDANQGTLWAWVWLDSAGNAGQLRYLFDAYVDANNRISVYISAANNLVIDVIGAGTTQTATTSVSTIKAQTWTHIVVTWSKNVTVNGTNYLYVYVNGAGAGSTSAPVAMTSLPTTFSIGSDYLNRNCLSGYMAYKLTRYWMSSTDITNDYASGAGDTSFFTVSPHTVALGLTTESSTGIVYHTRGKAVSAIVDGATEDTVTTSTGSNTVFADNDRAIVSAGNGYSSNIIGNTFVDGTPSSTSVNVDDGAGADVGELEKIGKSLSFDGVNDYVNLASAISFADNTPYRISFWANPKSGWWRGFINSGNNSSQYFMFHSTNYLLFKSFNLTYYVISTANSVILNQWQYYSISVDNAGIMTVYIDGIFNKSTDVGDSSVALSKIGGHSSLWYEGSLDDVRIYNRALTPAEILWEATHPSCSFAELHAGITVGTHETTLTAQANSGQKVLTVADSSSFVAGEIIRIVGATPETVTIDTVDSPTQITVLTNLVNTAANGSAVKFSSLVLFHKYSDGVATDLSIYGNNGTVTGATYAQSANLSRNLISNGTMANLGGWNRYDAATTLAVNTTAPIADLSDLKITNGDATQAYVGQSLKTASGEDYYFYGLVKGPTTVNGASQLVDVDGTASMGITATQAGLTAGVTTETEFCFQSADTDTTIDLGTGSVTNAEIAYWDNVEVQKNYVVNGGCEGAADPPTSWVAEVDAGVVSDTSPHAGTNCMFIGANATLVGASQAVTLVSGQYYTVGCYLKATAGDSIGLYVDYGDGVIHTIGTTTSTTWTRVRGSFKATGTNGVIYIRAGVDMDIGWADDVWLIRDDSASANTSTKGAGIIPSNQPKIMR